MADEDYQGQGGDSTEESNVFTQPKEKDSRWAFDASYLLLQIRAALHGGSLTTDSDGNTFIHWPIPGKPGKFTTNKPKMSGYSGVNDYGIEMFMSKLNFLITKVQKLAITREQRVYAWCAKVDWELSKMCFAGMMQENESDPSDLNLMNLTPTDASNYIVFIMNLFESNYSSSIEGKGQDFLKESEKQITHIQTGKSGGLLGAITGRS